MTRNRRVVDGVLGGVYDGLPSVGSFPWAAPKPFGPELWALANFKVGGSFNSTILAPSLTGNSTQQTIRTLASLGVLQQDMAFRLTGTVVSMPNTGWAFIQVGIVDNSGNDIAGTNPQMLATNALTWDGSDFTLDFKPTAATFGASAFLELRIQVYNNVTSGTLSVTNLSLKEIASDSRPMFYADGNPYIVNGPVLHQRLWNPVARIWQDVRTKLGADGALDRALVQVDGYDGPVPWRNPPADPTFVAATGTVTNGLGSTEEIGTAASTRPLRSNNNDQIIEVLKQDGTTFELRGNVHGGETLRSAGSPDLLYEVDKAGDGAWSTWDGASTVLRTCRRFRFTYNTKLTRSSPDSDDFANVDHRCVFFPDGMMRMDRTTTFLETVTLRTLFEWMMTETTTPKLGRIGKGLTTLGSMDMFTKLATPAAPTAAADNGAGSLAAATYRYVITALAEGGETSLSPAVTQAVTGGTSTVTLTLPALATGQTGWRVYGRANSSTRMVLLAVLGPTATTWADDGTVPASGLTPPIVNTARRVDQTYATDSATADADWAVWKDLPTGICLGSIFDRGMVLSRSDVASTRTKISSIIGPKIYNIANWTGGLATRSIASGTVWTATHWYYAYLPADPNARWEHEIAEKAADLSRLKAQYPAT